MGPTSNLMSFLSKILKNLKTHFRIKFGARVKIKLQIVFKTINFIYPENLCLSGGSPRAQVASPLSPFCPLHWQNLALSWSKHGPLQISCHFCQKILTNLKTHFRVKFGARVKIKLQIVFKTINCIYPENLGLSGLFLSKEELHEINAPLPQ